MKRTKLILFLLSLIAIGGIAQKRTIVNPAYEVKNTGIDNVAKIELTDTATLTRKPAVVSPAIDRWIKEQLTKAPKKTLETYELSSFFTEKQSRLIGCIKGYDTRLGFTTGIIYANNTLTREDYPIVVKIEPDGRFEAEIPMNMPGYTSVTFNEQPPVPFYQEPGQTLCVILDWNEFLTADRKRNIRYAFSNIEYRGALASLNKELLTYPTNSFNYQVFDKKRKTMAPLDFKADQLKEYDNNMTQYKEYTQKHSLSEKAKTILRNKIMLENANNLFNYVMSRDYYAKQDTANMILKMQIPASYYDFLKQLPLNDPSLLVSDEFSEFINRFEYNDLFTKSQTQFYTNLNANRPKPEKNLLEYLDEEKIAISPKEREFLSIAVKQHLSDDDRKQLEQMHEVSKNFSEKHKEQIKEYSKKYIEPLTRNTISNNEIEIWKLKDCTLHNELDLAPNLVYEIAKVRSLDFLFKNATSKENANELWNTLKEGIKTPYLIKTGQGLLDQAFPDTKITPQALPNNTGADIFRKIINPFKGKVLFIDFWGTTCGPCVAGIKQMKDTRTKYAANPDFDFIFITDQKSSPEKDYNDFVKEQEMRNTYRISTDDFNMLRQLFKFNGIPRYVAIDSKGDVLKDKFEMWNFETELGKILPAYNK